MTSRCFRRDSPASGCCRIRTGVVENEHPTRADTFSGLTSVAAPAVPSRPSTPAGNPTPPSGSDSSPHRAVTTSSQLRLSPSPAATAPPATGLFSPSPPFFKFGETPTRPNAAATLFPSTSNSTPRQFNFSGLGTPSNTTTAGNGGGRTSTSRSSFVFPSAANNNGGSTNNNVNTGGGRSSSGTGTFGA